MHPSDRAERSWLLFALLGLAVATMPGCGSDTDNGNPNAPGSTGGSQASGGGSPIGGNATLVGGTRATSGGQTSTVGGSALPVGGAPSSTGGTTSAAGGSTSPSGGSSATQGGTQAAVGGIGNTGGAGVSGGSGASLGGTAGGGKAAGGTISTAGGNGAAGAVTGGVPASGGGTSNTGGGPAGGATGGTAVGGTGVGGAATGGASTGGAATGGASTAGAATGGAATGGTGVGGTATGGTATGGVSCTAPGITKDADVQMTYSGLTVVSYGGYLNGESFQQDGITTYNGYQYTAFWNTNRNVVMARRQLPSGAWQKFDFTDYTNTADDAHNTISIGICPGDGTMHLSFDHHGNNLHYRRSSTGFVTDPGNATWAASSFGAVTSALVGSTTVTLVTYPRFVTEPGGNKMLFGARIGESGSGDEYLWEYDATSHAWVSLGKYIDGITDNINAYPHGLSYSKGGSRLHVSWCWRATSNASTNYDLLYMYSDDHGRTWKNNAGSTVATTGATAARQNSSGIQVWAIGQNRGLINQEHMAVDGTGRVHVLLAHMPDGQADDSNFDSARTKSQYFHYWRNASGTWTRTPIAGLASILNFRGKLALSSTNNVYAILPDLRIAGASASCNFSNWTLLDDTDAGRFFSDPLIDTARLVSEDKLTVYYPQKSSPNIYTLDYTLE